jgi:hypothetical protein
MPYNDYFIMMGLGGFFIILGIIMVFRGRGEEKGYYDSLTDRPDAREFLEHWPQRPRLGGVKIGGWIALAIGLVLVVVGGIFWLRG